MATTASGIYYPTASTAFPLEDILQDISDSLETLLGSSWTAYTPTWTGSTNPTLGNGNLAGRYRRVGKTVQVQIDLTTGSTTTYGTGTWSFALPASSMSSVRPVGAAYGKDNSTAKYYVLAAIPTGSNLVIIGPDNGFVDATHPFAWASGDELHMSVTYETS